jgi:hypothetical protein
MREPPYTVRLAFLIPISFVRLVPDPAPTVRCSDSLFPSRLLQTPWGQTYPSPSFEASAAALSHARCAVHTQRELRIRGDNSLLVPPPNIETWMTDLCRALSSTATRRTGRLRLELHNRCGAFRAVSTTGHPAKSVTLPSRIALCPTNKPNDGK